MPPKTVKAVLESLPSQLDREAAEDVDAVYQFDLTGPQGGHYTLTVREGTCRVAEGLHEEAHVTLSMSGEDCLKILTGQLSGSAIVMTGRLKVSGDIGLAMQLPSLFPGLGRSES
jgi:putative sterol carrier protein